MDIRIEPINKIPLTRTEMTALGRFAVIFGQIDHHLTQTLCHLVYVDQTAGYQAMEYMTTGTKLNHLRKNLFRIRDAKVRKQAKKFVDDIGGLIERRNHMFHGIWGWHLIGADTMKPGCNYPKNPKVTIYPEKIEIYANRVAKLSFDIHKVFCAIVGTSPPTPRNPNPKYCFSDDAQLAKTLQKKGVQIEEVGRSFEGHQDQD